MLEIFVYGEVYWFISTENYFHFNLYKNLSNYCNMPNIGVRSLLQKRKEIGTRKILKGFLVNISYWWNGLFVVSIGQIRKYSTKRKNAHSCDSGGHENCFRNRAQNIRGVNHLKGLMAIGSWIKSQRNLKEKVEGKIAC